MAKPEKGSLFPMSLAWLRDPVLIVAVSLVFGMDQVTKAVVRHNLLLGESISEQGTFRITRTFNTGSAFGLFPDQTLFLIVASVVGIGVLLLVYRNHPLPSFPVRLSLGMLLGGALGNLVDRLRMGQVTDFIELGFWPVFNLADAAIVIGILIMVWSLLFTRKGAAEAPGGTLPGHGVDGKTPTEAQSSEWPRWAAGDPGQVPCSPVGESCTVCGSAMRDSLEGRSCSGCGVKEWVRTGSRRDL